MKGPLTITIRFSERWRRGTAGGRNEMSKYWTELCKSAPGGYGVGEIFKQQLPKPEPRASLPAPELSTLPPLKSRKIHSGSPRWICADSKDPMKALIPPVLLWPHSKERSSIWKVRYVDQRGQRLVNVCCSKAVKREGERFRVRVHRACTTGAA